MEGLGAAFSALFTACLVAPVILVMVAVGMFFLGRCTA